MSGGSPEEQLAEARALGRAGSLRAAEALLSELLARDPGLARAYNDRGCVRLELGQLDGALRDLAEALRLAPEFTAARRNFEVVSNLVEQAQAAAGELGAASTVSTALAGAAQAGSFADALVDYLRAAVSVPTGQEDLRDDAIQEVALRVVGLSREEDLPLAEALRRLRRSSTRAWVRNLLGLARRQQGGGELPEELAAPSPPAPAGGALRVEALLAGLQEEFLAGAQSATKWRRRLVWDVYVGSLLEGVRLTRREVIETLRRLKVSARRAKDSQILADLDLITAFLRRRGPGEGGG